MGVVRKIFSETSDFADKRKYTFFAIIHCFFLEAILGNRQANQLTQLGVEEVALKCTSYFN